MNTNLSQEIIKYLEKNLKSAKTNFAAFFRECKKKYRAMEVSHLYDYILENNFDNPKLIEQTLREINSTKYIQNFNSLLDFIIKNQNPNHKTLAIKVIASYKNTKAVPILLECLKDENSNYKVRFAAADALGKIGDKNAFDTLSLIASNENEKSTYVKESAVVALGNLGDKRAINIFSSILSDKQMFLDKFSYLKERIVEAISKLDVANETKAIEILKKSLLENSPCVRISAIEAFMKLETKESYDLIYERLRNDESIEVQKNALVALYNLSDRKILDEVLMGNFNQEVKFYALDLIKEYEEDNE